MQLWWPLLFYRAITNEFQPTTPKVATAEMIIGMYDTPPAHRWTMDEFHNVVAWPEENVQGSRAGAAEASAMDDDEDDDASEDAEDNEEEEDTNDNTC
ncbi:hypothetical protein LR48_Vigan11g055800 [Vigna angularis]|uniref:Uncharacterized protein n=1 Tax=Phaseolus angularis TaxID=3914 RepID=A0A0L9VR40_PHAAN|nr:hypothetical protein LR48_Vigan11g055800 [Vigna angularis]